MLSLPTKTGRTLIAVVTAALACVPAVASARPVDVPPRQDLRSPDTRDIADGREYPPTPTVVTLRKVRAPEVTSSEFDWTAATTGAGAALGLVLLTTAGVLLVRRRTHHDLRAS